MRRRLKGPVPISSVLNDSLKRMGLEVKLKQHQVFSLWSEVVGPKICHHAQPIHIRGGRLLVAVEDSMWLHQLNFLKHQILIELNKKLDRAPVYDIILRVGEVNPLLRQAEEKNPSPSRPQVGLGTQEKESVRAILSPIKDQGCREVVQRLLRRFYLGRSSQESNNPLNK